MRDDRRRTEGKKKGYDEPNAFPVHSCSKSITSQGPQGGFVPRPYFTDYILAACQPGDEDGI